MSVCMRIFMYITTILYTFFEVHVCTLLDIAIDTSIEKKKGNEGSRYLPGFDEKRL
jgi:hypothetical protein